VKITLTSTDEIVWIGNDEAGPQIPGRIWEGRTERGIYVQCIISSIATLASDDQTQFEAQLKEQPAPAPAPAPRPRMFPLRMVM
jgi:hypothetical protein